MNEKTHNLCRFTIDQEKEICNWYTDGGLNLRQIAKKTNCNPETIRHILHRYKISTKDRRKRKDRYICKTLGYVFKYAPMHPKANRAGYILEHRLLMEQRLGRFLKNTEIIHHKNRIRSDNRNENLQLIVNNGKHVRKHWKTHPITCPFCNNEFKIK